MKVCVKLCDYLAALTTKIPEAQNGLDLMNVVGCCFLICLSSCCHERLCVQYYLKRVNITRNLKINQSLRSKDQEARGGLRK